MSISKVHAAVLSAMSAKRGAAMVEYALLAALIAVVALGTLTTLGSNVSSQFSSIATKLAPAAVKK